ncbi:MAG: M20/M25/M40 family metallo-hydrolase [Acidobacteriota bacterium]|nr:M20/M25/M40 family metallo-hydrolase [Acidobacteriota bacterium]MDQ7087709.1 M20/M25/M40 family metallo-hydrolase [Acidobacteriota bacterium]
MTPTPFRPLPAVLLLAALLGPACGGGPRLSRSAPGDPAAAAEVLIDAALADATAYQRLAELCDRFGGRSAGSEALAGALRWAAATLNADGAENVRLEPVTVTAWIRGAERLTLLEPAGPRDLPLLGLGRSVGTPPGGIEAEVVVVSSFDDLRRRGAAVRGKIVLYDFPMKTMDVMFKAYGEAVAYRWKGAEEAARHGAVAALVRSVTTRSLGTPHTGAMKPYVDDLPRIPAAAITVEDAASLHRLTESGQTVRVRLEMEARELPDQPSANVIGELRGREKPEEVVVIGAHIDSWDVGQGAHDDGAGVIFAIEALRLIRQAGLVPRRTLRVVLFTNEEKGNDGGKTYLADHEAELNRHAAALEADTGGFAPTGFSFAGSDEDAARIEAWMPLFAPLGELKLTRGGAGADIGPIVKKGVPGLGLRVDSTHYFDYHHSAADTLDKVDEEEFRRSLAAFTLMSWLLADSF